MASSAVHNPDDYRPPPSGSREAVLPSWILDLIDVGTYLSTGCETGRKIEAVMVVGDILVRYPDLPQWAEAMHGMCRKAHKYTFASCHCACHQNTLEGEQ